VVAVVRIHGCRGQAASNEGPAGLAQVEQQPATWGRCKGASRIRHSALTQCWPTQAARHGCMAACRMPTTQPALPHGDDTHLLATAPGAGPSLKLLLRVNERACAYVRRASASASMA
jgi:hypothetical protein